jgi:hypothetical protein
MDELTIEGKKHISSKRAAQQSGYSKDYIGQLCRAGILRSKMVGRSWYIEEEALKAHRKMYQGEPVISSRTGETETVPTRIRDTIVRDQQKKQKDEKQKKLDESFTITYEKDESPLMPLIPTRPKGKAVDSAGLPNGFAESETQEGTRFFPEEINKKAEQFPFSYSPLSGRRVIRVDVNDLFQEKRNSIPEKQTAAQTGRRSSYVGMAIALILVVGAGWMLSAFEWVYIYDTDGVERREGVEVRALWTMMQKPEALP